MSYLKRLSLAVSVLLFFSCSSVTSNQEVPQIPGETPDWLIPSNEVVQGGVPKDGIASLDEPNFAPTSQIDYVADERLIIGVRIDDTIKGYPHQIMDHHEIVNDNIGQRPFCLTYCPLTGTGIAFDRVIDGETVEFGVSGLLFRNNLIPYDRKTDSNYSQMQMRSVNGSRSGARWETIQVFQTTWATWKTIFPHALVLTDETGHQNRDYEGYLYGKEYLEEDSEPLFPLKHDNIGQFDNKERVYGVIEKGIDIDQARVRTYAIDNFGNGVNLKEDQHAGTNIVVAGSTDLDFAVGFERSLADGTELEFEPVQNALPVIMEDQEGNRWDIFGYAVEGPREGERLTPTLSYYGYFFAFGEFFLWG